MKKHRDMRELLEVKLYLYNLNKAQLSHEAVSVYGVNPEKYATIEDLRAALVAIEENNYFK